MALIGLLSDSHGEVARTRHATEILRDAGAQTLIHLGDVESPAVLDELLVAGGDGGPLPVRVVFGNVDWDPRNLTRHAEAIGIAVDHPAGRLTLPDGSVLAYSHGHLPNVQRQALADGARYFCHGHTHTQRDETVGRTRLINPGALHRASRYTVALLDTDADQLTFYPVDIR